MFAIKEQLGQLAEVAAMNAPPADVAKTMLENLPEENDDLLVAILNDPTWFDRLCVVQPKLAPHRAWLEQVRAEILKAFEPDKPANGAA